MLVRVIELPSSGVGMLTKNPTPSDFDYMLYLSTSGEFRVYFKEPDGTSRYVPGCNISDGNWWMIGGTYDGAELISWANGQQINTRYYSDKYVRETNTVLHIAHGWAGYAPIEVAVAYIYKDKALTGDEIQHNHLNPMSPVTDGLVLWLKMEEGSGTTVHDYSGYGNDGTIYGASWTEITHDPVRTLSPVRVLSNVR